MANENVIGVTFLRAEFCRAGTARIGTSGTLRQRDPPWQYLPFVPDEQLPCREGCTLPCRRHSRRGGHVFVCCLSTLSVFRINGLIGVERIGEATGSPPEV
jgi:hypothetical protein